MRPPNGHFKTSSNPQRRDSYIFSFSFSFHTSVFFRVFHCFEGRRVRGLCRVREIEFFLYYLRRRKSFMVNGIERLCVSLGRRVQSFIEKNRVFPRSVIYRVDASHSSPWRIPFEGDEWSPRATHSPPFYIEER